MAITNKAELAAAILASFSKPAVTEADKAKEAANAAASEIAQAIEDYVQFQIGLRLEEILSGIAVENLRGQPSPIIPSYNFSRFTRKTSS